MSASDRKQESWDGSMEKRKRKSDNFDKKKGKIKKSSNGHSEQQQDVRLNSKYTDSTFKEQFIESWRIKDKHIHPGTEIINSPFTCGFFEDFLQDGNVLEGALRELQELNYVEKNNDLYKFRQTVDLKKVNSSCLSSLRTFIYGDFRQWLTEMTGIPLNDKIDLGSSQYGYTDYLLCHDDELEGRRIAYILYLTKDWTHEDGGCLELFNTDDNAQPKKVVKSLHPKWNSFAFFEVSPTSFHQVAEVLSKDKLRLSLNGWFHGPDIVRPPKYQEPRSLLKPPGHIEQEELYSWINPIYLDMASQKEIRRRFKEDSEIELESFLAKDKYEEVKAALCDPSLKWKWKGPANKRHYQSVKQTKVADIVQRCLAFLHSEAMFLILSQLTGLHLHKLAPQDSDSEEEEEDAQAEKSKPSLACEVRRWSPGCYTLIHDHDPAGTEYALDTLIFFGQLDNWKEEFGGFTSYVAKDEDEELLTVVPQSNSMALVYRDKETLKFRKYINKAAQTPGNADSTSFFDISCTYYE
ncbi:prolyl 3-hydroxylase sud1 [Oratosquilla oratoria]|uniref:prolyl 3-hydroxylase sud1 n=1 Tax=Oratosquilla oratoria TaxID=337810 RepID=UPI003F7616A8